jgi:hypothetical protein
VCQTTWYDIIECHSHDILILILLRFDPCEVNLILKTLCSLLILNGRYRILDSHKICMITIIPLCFADTCFDKSNQINVFCYLYFLHNLCNFNYDSVLRWT